MELLRSEYDLDDLPEPFERRGLVEDVLIPGGVAGALGGLVSALAALGTARVLGHEALLPLKLLGCVFFRHSAADSLGPWVAALGLVVHLGGAVTLGATFALALPRGGTGAAAVGWSMLTGLAFYAVVNWLLLDFMDPPLARAVPVLALFPFDMLAAAFLPTVVPLRRALSAWVRARHALMRTASCGAVHPSTVST